MSCQTEEHISVDVIREVMGDKFLDSRAVAQLINRYSQDLVIPDDECWDIPGIPVTREKLITYREDGYFAIAGHSFTISRLFSCIHTVHLSVLEDNITDLNIQLFEDNKELAIQGSGLSTDILGRKFEASFDSISSNISEIKIIVNSITALDKPMFSIDLSKINFPYKIKSENYYIELLGFTFDDDYVYLTIKTDIDVFVLDVNLYSNKKLLPFIVCDIN